MDPINATAQTTLIATQTALQAAATGLAFYQEFKKFIPQVEDEVTVEVIGQPGSTKRDLYYLALSTACSLVRRMEFGANAGVVAPPPTGLLMIEYDAADHWVRCTLKYVTSLLSAAIAADPKVILRAAGISGNIAFQVLDYMRNAENGKPLPAYADMVLFKGPADEVVGKSFNFTGGVLAPGIPTSERSIGAPKLPWADRTILTTASECLEPTPGFGTPPQVKIQSPNPKPPGDGRSRGAVYKKPLQNTMPGPNNFGLLEPENVQKLLIPLVFSALSDPGSYNDQYFPAPDGGPRGDDGNTPAP